MVLQVILEAIKIAGSPPEGQHILAAKNRQKRSAVDPEKRESSLAASIIFTCWQKPT